MRNSSFSPEVLQKCMRKREVVFFVCAANPQQQVTVEGRLAVGTRSWIAQGSGSSRQAAHVQTPIPRLIVLLLLPVLADGLCIGVFTCTCCMLSASWCGGGGLLMPHIYLGAFRTVQNPDLVRELTHLLAVDSDDQLACPMILQPCVLGCGSYPNCAGETRSELGQWAMRFRAEPLPRWRASSRSTNTGQPTSATWQKPHLRAEAPAHLLLRIMQSALFNRGALLGAQPAVLRARRSVRAAATPKPINQYYIRDESPWPTESDIQLKYHDVKAQPYVDLIVAGGGPSGVAVAERVAAAGYSVCVVDPEPFGVWPNNYGVWVDEFQAMGLEDCLEVIWPKAKVWLDSDKHGEK